MPNLIWPRALSRDVGPTGLIGRTIHWLGVGLAVAILVTALGWLTVAAVATALGARGVRYLLARE
jgi:hypothetical protein